MKNGNPLVVTGTSGRLVQGNVADILPDGTYLGNDVEPSLNPSGIFVVVELPGVDPEELQYLKRKQYGADIVVPRPGHPDGDRLIEPVIRSRRHRLDISTLTNSRRNAWGRGEIVYPGASNRSQFENSVRDWVRADALVRQNNVPRDRGNPGNRRGQD